MTDTGRFWISDGGDLYFWTPPSFEEGQTTFPVTVTATDGDDLSGSIDVMVNVTDVEEEGIVTISPPRGWADPGTQFTAELTDDDGVLSDGDNLISWKWERSTNRSNWQDIGATSNLYTATERDVDHYLRVTASYTDMRSANKEASAALTQRIGELKPDTNAPPVFEEEMTTRSVGQGPRADRPIGDPVKATDPDDDDVLTYSLSGTDADNFNIDPSTGQLLTKAVLDPEEQSEHVVTVEVHDGFNAEYQVDVKMDDSTIVTITVTEVSEEGTGTDTGTGTGTGGGGGGGGGGGPPPVPVPSDADFEWNVTRDIDSLDRDNDLPTGIWSDAETIWVLENASSGADTVFAYDLQTGERRPEQDFELDSRNRFSHGIWSDGETVWVADSGQDRLFAYALADGERQEERDIELAERNRDPRGIWSDGTVIYVLDSVKDALFVYNLESGALLAEYELDKLNGSPRGIWSDGFTLWVSDDGAKRLFAYRIEGESLNRHEDLEFSFRSLLKAGNGEPRGIWSDGEVVFVADEQDDRLYSYNLPDAIDARLASLSLSDIDIGEFAPHRLDYTAIAGQAASVTTVIAEATQETATVEIEPGNAGSDPETGHQVALETETTITVTVTSNDGSRTTTYRVLVTKPPCLGGLGEERLSEVSFIGGSVSELEACARSVDVSALYHNRDGVWTALFFSPHLPDFLSRPFRSRFREGLAPGTPLIAHRQNAVAATPGVPNSN